MLLNIVQVHTCITGDFFPRIIAIFSHKESSTRPIEHLEVAIDIISNSSKCKMSQEYLDGSPAKEVINCFGPASSPVRYHTRNGNAKLKRGSAELSLILRSLGIPTWRYGREPSNCFATYHAKYFSSALRLDALVSVASGGFIFTPGGAGNIAVFYVL